MKKTFLSLVVLVAGLSLGTGNSHADTVVSGLDHTFQMVGKMSLQVNAGATVMITLSNGDVILVDSQDQIPEDLSGATVDVFDGCVQAAGSNSISLCVGSEKGVAKALVGLTAVTTDEGKSLMLKEGDQYEIHFQPLEEANTAPQTAAGGELGSPIDGFDPYDDNEDDRDNSNSP